MFFHIFSQSQFLLSLQAISIMVHFYMGTKGPENVSSPGYPRFCVFSKDFSSAFCCFVSIPGKKKKTCLFEFKIEQTANLKHTFSFCLKTG